MCVRSPWKLEWMLSLPRKRKMRVKSPPSAGGSPDSGEVLPRAGAETRSLESRAGCELAQAPRVGGGRSAKCHVFMHLGPSHPCGGIWSENALPQTGNSECTVCWNSPKVGNCTNGHQQGRVCRGCGSAAPREHSTDSSIKEKERASGSFRGVSSGDGYRPLPGAKRCFKDKTNTNKNGCT